MAGGDKTIFEKAKPILEHFGKSVILMSETGAGNTTKLAINTLLAFHAQGLAESVVLARQNQINIVNFISLINNGALGNAFIKIKGDAIIQNNYATAFAPKPIAKELRLAKDIGLSTPMRETVFKTFQQAETMLGEEDIIAIIKQINPA
jgi:3-hydroxyisobutyrate dehydrogenase